MEMKFYRCSHCGQIIAIVKETGVPVVCCGEPMAEVIPGTTDASLEKHLPVYTVEGNTGTYDRHTSYVKEKSYDLDATRVAAYGLIK